MELNIAWTNWPHFTFGMFMRAHSDDTIRKVIGGNMLRALEARTVWGLQTTAREAR